VLGDMLSDALIAAFERYKTSRPTATSDAGP
jgi:hypothetical protein